MYPSPGEDRDRPAGLASCQVGEHVPARPPAVPGEQREMDGVDLTAATAHPRQPRPEPARLERRERRGRLPDAEHRRPRRVGAGRRRGATAGAEQPGEPQPGCAAQAKPVGAQPSESHRGAPRWLADQMERRDARHEPDHARSQRGRRPDHDGQRRRGPGLGRAAHPDQPLSPPSSRSRLPPAAQHTDRPAQRRGVRAGGRGVRAVGPTSAATIAATMRRAHMLPASMLRL